MKPATNELKYLYTFNIPAIPQVKLSVGHFGVLTANTPPDKYRVWVGGCSIYGSQETIEAARAAAYRYAKSYLNERKVNLEAKLKEVEATLAKLGDDPFNLGQFMVATDSKSP